FLGSATSAPFSIIYSNAPAGTNSLYAVVTDSVSQVATSAVVNVAFFNTGLTLVSPADGDIFLNTKPLTISALGMLPAGAITHVDFFVDGVKIGVSDLSPFSLVWSNVTGGSHRLTAVGTSDGGQSFASQPVAIGVAKTLVSKGSVWNYLDDGSDQGTNWYLPTFSDNTWASGPAELGYGDGDEVTVVNGGPTTSRLITTYFRRAFVASNLSAYASFVLNVKRDDGAVVYLNGVEAARFNMNQGPVNYLTLALNADDDGTNFWPAAVLPKLFLEGTNLLAVEIHQTAANSSDISFDLELLGIPAIIRNLSPGVTITNLVDDSSFVGLTSLLMEATASDRDGNVTNVAFYADGLKLAEATASPYNFTWVNPPVGAHVLTAVATDDQGATTISAGIRVKLYDVAGNPLAQILSPASGTVVEGPTNMLVTASVSALDSVTHVQFFADGGSIGDVAAVPYEVVWTAPFGNSILTAVAYGANGKTGTSTGVSVTITIPPTNTVAPTIAAEYPPAGSIVSSLTNVLVTFSERVQGVDASDLMINGIPAAAVTGNGSNYNFTFPQPPYGEVTVSWAVGHGITDFGWPANLPFYELSPEGRWEYELVDRNPPTVIARTPAQGALITNLTQITVTFSEPVAGVDASDLLVAGVPATDVSSNGNQYIFSVVQPPSGTVNITWGSTNGITDLAVSGPNPFNGSSANARWSFTLDTRTIFVQTNSAWKFIKGLAEASTPTNAWRQQGFDDSSWSNAFAPFFYGDPYSNGVSAYTLLSDMRSNYTSIYLRKEFIVPNVTALTNLLLAAQSDDGFVAWVNGVEVVRYNVPAGELSYTNVASTTSPEPQNNGAGYIVYSLTNIAPFLVNGVNTLAVHAFNESLTTSSDFGFNAQIYSYLSDAAFAPPRLFQANPAPGDVFYLTNITVKFSEPVSGVDASDLLINGVPAATLSSDGGAIYTFGFAQPAYGAVVVSWVTDPGIVDFDQVPKPFNGAAAGSILRYTLLNPSAPTVVNSSPAAGLTLISLTDVTVTFSEPVSGVKASDLLINGRPANSVVFNTAATYTFGFAQPAYGKVNIRWATNNGIQDLETPANAFDPSRLSSQWSYNLIDPVPTVALTSPAINSFFLVGSDITVRATATDNDGTISLVELFENGNKLSDSPTAPYTYTWSGAALGAHTLRALATDNSGLRATSAPVVITVVTSLPATLLRGPYLQVGAPNGGVIRWRTDLLSDSVVSFGTDPAALNQSVVLPNQTNEHIVAVSGLLPDTKYFYSIGSSSQTLASGANYWFVTPPVPGTRKHTRFWALGDSGTANASAVAVRDAYYAYAATNGPADFWLMLGDNAYNSGLDTEYQRAVFDMYPDTLRNMFLWPTIGNHESSQAFTAADYPYLHIFTLPQNAEAGGVPSGSPRYYSFDYANIHFVSLDSMTSGRTTNTAMAQWLISDLAATAQDWIIVFFHHPPYTKGSHNSDAETELIEIRQNLVPILEANGVDLVLSGHSHVFERSYLLNGHYGLSSTLTPGMKLDGGDGREGGTGPYQKNISGQGVVYTVAGSSGQIGGGSLNHPAHFISLNELGSLVIDVSSNKLHAEFLASTGVARDSFDLLKRNFAPIADDATIALNEDTQTPVTLKASGNNLTYTVVSAPSHGVATYINPVTSLPVVIGNGTVLGGITSLLYTPASNFFGADSLTFKAADGSLESALGTINLVVQSVNDAPVADASATPMRTLVSANNLNAPAVLDGSRSYDVDHDPLQYYWREGASLLANTMVSIVTLPVGPHNISLVVNDGELSGTDSLLVEVLTPGQSVQRLMMVVNNGASVPKPLLASLEAARAAFDRGNFNAAFNELHAFQNKVSAQVLSKNPTLGNQLIALAQSLMDAISGPNPKPRLVMGKEHGAGNQKVKFSGNAAKTYVVESSTDLVHWQQVGTANHKGNGDFEFDAGAANGIGAQFYRVIAPE
ncbi:MAG: uncharacterized protein JWM16_3167, partial [Verrucomicrobiales bacterium]|nr:uncharacterized protein [Verrucomicrobiales bacterium]